MAWKLCSKSDIVSLHPITEGELQDTWSDMVEALIKQHLGQPNLGTTAAVADEWHDGDGTNLLFVKKPPISAVSSVSISDSALVAADYVVFDSYVALKSQVFPKGILNVKISYTSGATTVDDVVSLTAAAMIIAIINYRKRYGADASLKWGTAEQKAGEETPNYNVGLTSHLVRIMKQLLRRPKVRVS